MSIGKAFIVAILVCAGWVIEVNLADAAVGKNPVNRSSKTQGGISGRAKPGSTSGLITLSGTSPNGIYHRVNNSATIGGSVKSYARSTQAIDGTNFSRKR
jgi:hypothetical protein